MKRAKPVKVYRRWMFKAALTGTGTVFVLKPLTVGPASEVLTRVEIRELPKRKRKKVKR